MKNFKKLTMYDECTVTTSLSGNTNSINYKKKELKVLHSSEGWKLLRSEGVACYADWTDEDIENAIDGYIGKKCGVKCYLQLPYISC